MLKIKEAAERSGLSPDTLRAWERRYGVVEPERTAAGYRLYSDTDIEKLVAMRGLVEEGMQPQVAAEYVHRIGSSNGDGGADGGPSTSTRQRTPDQSPSAEAASTPSAPGSSAPLIEAAKALDVPAMAAFFDGLRALGSFETICERYLFPALRELGEAWANGRVSVAGEHAASAAAQRWLGAQYQAAARDSHSPTVLVGLPPGAQHELGALAHAVAMRRAGLAVLYLGPDLPEEDWLDAARKTGSRVAVIGVATARDVPAAQRVADAFRQELPEVRLAFGGRGAGALRSDGAVLPEELGPAVAAVRSEVAATS